MRAILAGGGTGGHVIPAIAIAQELKKLCGAELTFVGTARGMENRLVPAAGFPLRLIRIGALNQVNLKTRLKTFSDLPKSVLDSRRILSEFSPDIVIGVGGYASGPVMMAAVLRRLPTLVFEPNYVPGFTNRLLARWVSGAAVHFKETGRYFRRCEVTGVPVRQAFFDIKNKAADKGSPPTLLVFGGSQGAHAINEVVMRSVVALRARIADIRVIHQTGERDYNDAEVIYSGLGNWVEAHRFIDDMPGLFARADLVLCRSGASTVAEITAAGKPAIFVPFPRAADDHQKRNAEALARAGAAVMLEETELSPDRFIDTVSTLLASRPGLREMGEAARNLSYPNAAIDIAKMAVRLAGLSH
jgi:UDP-N-acetylglucosamine--N-acetylmuramyl-(pentapeptide) pyrophosphoryl-undecaprenol N-acetylglucosamine transferase